MNVVICNVKDKHRPTITSVVDALLSTGLHLNPSVLRSY